MSQRGSGYARRPNEDYGSPPWLAGVLGPFLRDYGVRRVWEPAPGAGQLAQALAAEGFEVKTTSSDFLQLKRAPWPAVDAIVTNPPYGEGRRNELACQFIRHALKLGSTHDFHGIRTVAMLLRVDFDSAKTRTDLFRDNAFFAGKLVLLDRIKWFDGPSSPSDNHAWFFWDHYSGGSPWVRYAQRYDKAT